MGRIGLRSRPDFKGLTLMDRRTIFAFVLIGVIIILTPYYMELIVGDRPRPQQFSEPPRPDRELSRSPRNEDVRQLEWAPEESKVLAPTSTEKPVVRDFTPKLVQVETDLFIATFSTAGGTLTSVVLKNYNDLDGNQLEILRPGSRALGVTLGSESFEDLEFVPEREHLSITGNQQGGIAFRAEKDGMSVEKRILFQANRYRSDMTLTVSGAGRDSKTSLLWKGGLANTEGNPEENAVYTMVVTSAGGEVDQWDVEDLGPDGDPLPSGTISWVSLKNKYFLAAFILPEGRYELNMKGEKTPLSAEEHYETQIVSETTESPMTVGLYFGPISYDLLRLQNQDLRGNFSELELDEIMDYGFLRPIMKPVTILILKAFLALHNIIPNYGIVIIVFSILIKIVVFPLTHKSLEAAAKMAELQPKIAALKEKHGGDQQKVSQDMMKLYKAEGVNPLGGCLPMLPQMPILFALFNVFRGAIELRQTDFAFWITDLSQPDRIFVGGFEVHILPLLMAVSSFFQSKMTMKDPKQAAMVYIMPIFMTWIFWSMSSGLVLYWTMFNVLTLAQQQIMERTKSIVGTQ
jgi:YidC/Oxa1 family membrane protein insertase